MTELEKLAKDQIIQKLNSEGYPSYAKLFALFDLKLTDNPNTVGAMIPNKAVMIINKNLDIDQVSVIVRHEILHEYLTHQLRMEQKLGADVWAKRTPAMHRQSNFAGDYEISNLGYTEEDKNVVRHIVIGDKIISGLVTEDDHPDWVNKSFEEIYDLLQDKIDDDKQNSNFSSLPDLMDNIDDLSDDMSDSQTQSSQSSKQGEEQSDNSTDSDDKKDDKKLDKLSKALDNVEDKAKDIQQAKKSNDDIFNTPEQSKEISDLKDRVAKIKRQFDELKQSKNLEREVQTKKLAYADKIAQRNADTYSKSPLARFKMSLNKFLKNYLSDDRSRSWRRFDKSTAATGLMRKGWSTVDDKPIPLFNVYVDQSGSWSDEDVRKAKSIIAVLYRYEREHKLKLQIYYFSTFVSSSEEEAREGGGTAGTPIINHIIKTNPQNVIIITDGDISDVRKSVTINGGAWFLFNELESTNIYNAIEAKLGKSKYIINLDDIGD